MNTSGNLDIARAQAGIHHVRLPLGADLFVPCGEYASVQPSARFRLGHPMRDAEPHYPGARPQGSYLVADGLTYPVKPSTDGRGWAVLDDEWLDIDTWLKRRGLPVIAERTAILAYGSNANPSQLSGLPAARPVVALRGILLGAAAAYCSTPRSDGQFPAGLVAASRNSGEDHVLLLVDAPTKAVLDSKEGLGCGTYDYVGLATGKGVDFILEDGTAWSGPLATYLQGHRRPLALDAAGEPVLLREVSQRDFMIMQDTGHIVGDMKDSGLPLTSSAAQTGIHTAPLGVFVYGTLRPGQSRWPHVEPYVIDHQPDSAVGRRVDTGLGFPGLVPDAESVTRGTLLRVRPESHRELIRILDAIEGHPDFYRRSLIRLLSGALAWAYIWCGDSHEEAD